MPTADSHKGAELIGVGRGTFCHPSAQRAWCGSNPLPTPGGNSLLRVVGKTTLFVLSLFFIFESDPVGRGSSSSFGYFGQQQQQQLQTPRCVASLETRSTTSSRSVGWFPPGRLTLGTFCGTTPSSSTG